MVKRCEVCGEEFTVKGRQKMCPVCKAVMSYKTIHRKNKAPVEDPLDKLLSDIRKYNEENGTSLSYGQYVARFGV